MLHVFNGDAAAALGAKAGLPGEIAVWADTLDQGPVPPADEPALFRETRARFLSDRGGAGTLTETRARLLGWDRALERAADHDSVVLWFEHDAGCQLALLHHLEQLSGHPHVQLVCIGAHPEVRGFRGLAQLSPEQLAKLLPAREEVTQPQRALARVVWNAFRAQDPQELWRLAQRDLPPLPFLGSALRRLLEEYPDGQGLSRSERHLLEAAAEGPARVAELFRRATDREPAPFLTDHWFALSCAELAAQPNALVQLGPGAPLERVVTITQPGRDVLTGRADRILLRGIDRWIGGVHLCADGAHFRRFGEHLVFSG